MFEPLDLDDGVFAAGLAAQRLEVQPPRPDRALLPGVGQTVQVVVEEALLCLARVRGELDRDFRAAGGRGERPLADQVIHAIAVDVAGAPPGVGLPLGGGRQRPNLDGRGGIAAGEELATRDDVVARAAEEPPHRQMRALADFEQALGAADLKAGTGKGDCGGIESTVCVDPYQPLAGRGAEGADVDFRRVA